MLEIIGLNNKKNIEDARKLLRSYAEMRNYDEALGDFESELKKLPGKFMPPDGGFYLIYSDGNPAGCISFHKFKEGICEMKRMYVLPDFQGNGFGKMLSQHCIEKARVAGYQKMVLDTHPWMKAAIKMYLNIGFSERDAYHYNPTVGIRFFELNLKQ